MLALGRVSRTGDIFERGGHRFEIVCKDAVTRHHDMTRVVTER